MKPSEKTTPRAKSPSSLAPFERVRDSRGRPVKFLQIRNGRYYATFKADGGDGLKKTRRFPLLNLDERPVVNLTEASDALARLRVDREKGALPTAGRKPNFFTYAETYLQKAATLAKKKGTLENEQNTLALWKAHLGSVPLHKLTTPMIISFREKRLKGTLKVAGKSGRGGRIAPATPPGMRLRTGRFQSDSLGD